MIQIHVPANVSVMSDHFEEILLSWQNLHFLSNRKNISIKNVHPVQMEQPEYTTRKHAFHVF
jgi:hypothetical protein